jgi:1,4-dihydroxy-2-naphthoate octaprenyltransferase
MNTLIYRLDKNNGNTCLPNENKQKTIITCNKFNRTMLKDIYLFFLIIFFLIMFFLIIFTSED